MHRVIQDCSYLDKEKGLKDWPEKEGAEAQLAGRLKVVVINQHI